MALTAGARLVPYEIQESIGAGGMGEVYRARDTRLNREVAVRPCFPTDGGQPRVISALSEKDIVLRRPEPNILLVRSPYSELPVRVERVDLKTAKRVQVAQMASAELAGAMEVTNMAITDDAKWYAYSILKQNSALFVIEPTK